MSRCVYYTGTLEKDIEKRGRRNVYLNAAVGRMHYTAHSNDRFGTFYIVRAGRNEGIFTSFLWAEDETRGVTDLRQIIPAFNWQEAVDVWTLHCLKNHQNNGRVQCSRAHLTARILLWGVKGLDYTFTSRDEAQNAIRVQNLGPRRLVCTDNSKTLYNFIYSQDEFAEDNKEELEGEKE
ncbi:hypothetical protein B0H19DRAFT_1371279 [Mycena capillaripes]|nr:hypothetical protein B0H19DRAFT_1371279 [Mycena capillaripes]